MRPFPASRQFGKPQNCRAKISFKSSLLIPTVSASTFHSTNLFLCSRRHIPTNSVAPAHNSLFLQLLSRRANTRNVSLQTPNGGQITLSTQLIIPDNLFILSHRCSTADSLETYSPFLVILFDLRTPLPKRAITTNLPNKKRTLLPPTS